jgi:hypothetical protein
MSDTTTGAGMPPDDQGRDGPGDDYNDSQPSGPLTDEGWEWLRGMGYGDARGDARGDAPAHGTDIARRQPIFAYSARSHAEQAAMSAARSNPSNPTPTTIRMALGSPTGGPGARVIDRHYQERNAMAALLNAVRPRGIASPPNVADLARWSRAWVYTPFGGELRRRKSDHGLRITLQPALPSNILALLWPSAQRIELNPALFDPRDVTAIRTELPTPSHMPTSLDHIIEASPLLRMVVALCWLRWYSWDDLDMRITDPLHVRPGIGTDRHRGHQPLNYRLQRDDPWSPMAAQAIGFAPIYARRDYFPQTPQDWQRYHADYYTDLWTKLLDLLVLPEQLTAQAEVMLMRRNLPQMWPARRQMIDEMARADGLDVVSAETQFIAELAMRSRVTTPLVRDRIDRPHTIRTLDDYQRLSNDLIHAAPALRHWRRRAAEDWRCDPADLALWLMEPFARVNIPHG